MAKPALQRTDAASSKRRDEMRNVARALSRIANGSGRMDGWQNAITLLGNSQRDKRLAASFSSQKVMDLEAEDTWRGDPFFARIVDTVPEEISRAGWELLVQPPPEKGKKSKKKSADAMADVFPETDEIESGKEVSEETTEYMKRLKLVERMEEAAKVERAKGGAAIWPIVDDGQRDLTKPLDFDRIRKVKSLEVLEPLELIPYQWFSDPLEPNFGMPELFWMQRIATGNVGSIQRIPIHVSRLIIFPGIVVSKRQLREHWGWGDSVLVRVFDALRDFQQSWGGAFVLMEDFAQSVMKVKGLAESFATGEDDLLMRRATQMDAARSIIRGVLIDSEEEWQRQTTNISGLSDMLDRCCNYLAAVAKIPVTILMGQAPAGLNATGASDIRAWFDSIAATRPRTTEPRLNRITKMVFRSKEGPTQGKEPARWSYTFGSLWQQTEKEQADTRKVVAETDAINIDKGVVLPEEITKSRYGGDKYSAETVLDQELREAHDEEVEEEAELEAEMIRKQVEAVTSANVNGTGAGAQPPTKTGPVPKDSEKGAGPGPEVPVGSKSQGPQAP